jgi:DNA-binding NarL/FixJ family response regulator
MAVSLCSSNLVVSEATTNARGDPSGHALRIVIADDHDAIRRLLREILESEDNWVVCGEASDGVEVIERTRDLHPDIVVMDIMMPRRNGFEATREIARIAPGVAVLVTTLYEFPELWRQARDAGAQGCVLKTESARFLIPAVKSVISHQPFFPAS